MGLDCWLDMTMIVLKFRKLLLILTPLQLKLQILLVNLVLPIIIQFMFYEIDIYPQSIDIL